MSRDSYQRTGQAQDAEQIWPGFTAGGFDHEDILLALAPKPVQVLAVTWDFFPIEGTRRTVERARRVWGLSGRGNDLRLTEDDSIHAYTPKLARTAAEFFAGDGATTFTQRLASVLGIDITRVKIVSVYEGSLVVETQILDDPSK